MAVDLSWNFRETGTNIANNTSTVQLDIYITTSGSSWNGDEQWGQVWWNGEHWTSGYTLPRNTTTLVHSETQTITHNSDGTGSTSFSCSIPTTPSGGSKYGEQTIGLTTLPRAASIDSFVCSSKYLDGTMTVKYTPKATFNYKLRLSIPNVVAIVTKDLGSQGTGQKTTTATFTSSELNTIYAKIGANANSCTIGAVIETWSGSTKVGESSEYMLTLYMPESIKPSIGTISLTEAVSGLNAKFGAFVQNKSKATVSFTASGYNAGGITSTIKSYNVSVNNQSFTTNSFTTNLLSTSGTNTITVNVTDSRGRTATKSQTFNVLGYTKPTISLFTANRNNTTNTTIDVLFSATISSLNNNNDKTFKIKLDNTDKQTYTDTYSKTNQAYAITGTSISNSYNVTLIVSDYFETVSRTIKVATGTVLLHCTEDGTKISMGQYYDSKLPGINQIYDASIIGRHGGSYIKARDNATVANTFASTSTYDPVVSQKTINGEWSIGHDTTSDNLTFQYTTDTNYNAGTNTTNRWNINTSGRFSGKSAFTEKLESVNGRITDANIAHTYENNKVHSQILIASNSMTSHKPASDGTIIHNSWDNSGQYCGQLYYPHGTTTQVQYRVCSDGTWGGWEDIYRCKNLYNSTSGSATTGNIPLNESAANFKYIDIFFARNQADEGYSWQRIYSPNGKRCHLFEIYTPSSGYTGMYSAIISISGTTATWIRGKGMTINGSWGLGGFTNNNEIKIYRIDGYR